MHARPHGGSLVSLSTGSVNSGGRRPIFCLHAVSGSAAVYSVLASALAPEFQVHAVQAAGLEVGGVPHTSVEEMASAYLAVMDELGPVNEYLLCGWSMGGVVSFELARLLERRGDAARVAMIDTQFPTPFAEPPSTAAVTRWYMRDVTASLGSPMSAFPADFDRLSQPDQLGLLLDHLKLGRGGDREWWLGEMQRRFEVFRANLMAATEYRPRPVSAEVLLVQSSEDALPVSGWEPVVRGRLTRVEVPGDHYTMIAGDGVGPVSELVAKHFSGPSRRFGLA